jgi:hypothetical protein
LDETIQHLKGLRSHMLAWHGDDSHSRLPLPTPRNIDQHLFKGVKLEHARERFQGTLRGELLSSVRRGDDREVATQGLLYFLVEVISGKESVIAFSIEALEKIPMIMGEQYDIDTGQLV